MRGAFKCRICLTVHLKPPIIITKPPIIITKCCKVILGHELCVNQWYSGPEARSKCCPACQCDMGYNETLLLRGLDDFPNDVREAMKNGIGNDCQPLLSDVEQHSDDD